jgi:hypothetical protein
MEDDALKAMQAQDDAYRRNHVPRRPLSDEVRRQLASSPVWQKRAQLALDVDLPPELIALLVRDEEMTVRRMTYDCHRNIPAQLLDEAIALHPEEAPQMAFQINAPLAALRLKPFNFASRDDIERYLAETNTDARRSRAFRSIVKSSSNALLTLDELMSSISR